MLGSLLITNEGGIVEVEMGTFRGLGYGKCKLQTTELQRFLAVRCLRLGIEPKLFPRNAETTFEYVRAIQDQGQLVPVFLEV